MLSMEESRGLHEIREPNPVWRFSKSSLRKRHFHGGLQGSGSEELGEGPILGGTDSMLTKLAEGQGGWSVGSREDGERSKGLI